MSTVQSTVFLVDDDPSVRKTLPRGLIRRGFQVNAYESAKAFLDAYSTDQPGCLVLDLSMPEMDGLELQRELTHRNIAIPIIFITGHGGVPQSVQALKAGAIDFLEKPFLPDVLIRRIEEAFLQDQSTRSEQQKLASIREHFNRLTDRENEVLRLILEHQANLSSKQMAEILGISHRTVEQHRSRVLEKTQAKSTSNLLAMATLIGLIQSDIT